MHTDPQTQVLIDSLDDILKSAHTKRLQRKETPCTDPMLEFFNRIEEFPSDDPEAEESRQRNIALKTLLGAESLLEIHRGWEWQDAIRELQAKYQISGLTWETFTCRGVTIEYWQHESRLDKFGNDAQRLQAQIPEIVAFFEQIIQIEPAYILLDTSDEEGVKPCDISEVREVVLLSLDVWIGQQSCAWQDEGERWIGRSVNRTDPDEITLSFDLPNGESRHFRASHPLVEAWHLQQVARPRLIRGEEF